MELRVVFFVVYLIFSFANYVESKGPKLADKQPLTLKSYEKWPSGNIDKGWHSLSKHSTSPLRLDNERKGSFGLSQGKTSKNYLEILCPFGEGCFDLFNRRRRSVPATIVDNTTFTDNSEVQKVLDLLEKGEEIVKTGPYEDVIITMGNTGAGKSTFTQFITGNDQHLISVERIENSGDFTIQDISGKISNTTWTSWTIFPELVVDKKTNTKFYDCPGFSDTRGVAHDIASTYFTKEAIKNTQRIKLLFFVNYPAVRVGVDRQDFMLLANHIVKAVKDIDKFKDSIALIVTKVDNIYIKGNLVGDKVVVETVAHFLMEVKKEVQRKLSSGSSNKQSEKEILKFIDILLKKDGDYYPRIGIFRRPDESGPTNQIALLQEGKKSLEKIIHLNTKYAKHEERDFDYTLSSKSKNSIHDIIETIKGNIVSSVSSVVKQIEAQFTAEEERIIDIEELRGRFQKAAEVFSVAKKKTVRPRDFVKLVTESMETLRITISKENLLGLTRYDRYLEFLESFGARGVKTSEWSEGFDVLIQHLIESLNWYEFLTEYVTVLSKYDVQRNKEDSTSLAGNFVRLMEAPENHSKERHEEMKEQFQEMFGRNSEIEYDKVKYSGVLSDVKLTKLKSVIDFALNSEANSVCDERNATFVIRGFFIKLSDVAGMLKESCRSARIVEIFALEKVFFDDDLDLTGKEVQVSIVSPTWVVIGNHTIRLNGREGPEIEGDNLVWSDSVKGGDGSPGTPGGPAGNFVGIGQNFIDGHSLSISANGGKGGKGQPGTYGTDGGHGSTPSARSDLNWVELHDCEDITNKPAVAARIGAAVLGVAALGASVLNPLALVPAAGLLGSAIGIEGTKYKKCTVYGRQCGSGGDGGVGGVGGIGGRPGRIEMIPMGILRENASSLIPLSTVQGKKGEDGLGGEGGRAGQQGRKVEFSAQDDPSPWLVEETNSWGLHSCSSGERGISGGNSQGQQQPRDSRKPLHPSEPARDFEAFAMVSLNNTVRQIHLRNFLREIETNELTQ